MERVRIKVNKINLFALKLKHLLPLLTEKIYQTMYLQNKNNKHSLQNNIEFSIVKW